MEIETILDIIKSRHSVRAYLDKPIEEETKAVLQTLIDECNTEGGLHIQLVIDEPKAFGRSIMAHYGKFRNVKNYLCLVGNKAEDTEERLGYYGEKIVLKAQELGLNSCWVGLSYNKSNTRYKLNPNEKLYALIAIGYGAEQGKAHKSKAAEQIFPDIDLAPAWFRRGVEYALLAPTALNQQKFKFNLEAGNKVLATTGWGFYAKMDLGIAKYHFELGAGKDFKVNWI